MDEGGCSSVGGGNAADFCSSKLPHNLNSCSLRAASRRDSFRRLETVSDIQIVRKRYRLRRIRFQPQQSLCSRIIHEHPHPLLRAFRVGILNPQPESPFPFFLGVAFPAPIRSQVLFDICIFPSAVVRQLIKFTDSTPHRKILDPVRSVINYSDVGTIFSARERGWESRPPLPQNHLWLEDSFNGSWLDFGKCTFN